MKITLVIIAAILSSVLCRPVERERRSANSCSSIPTAVSGSVLLKEIIQNLHSIRELSGHNLFMGAKSICEAFRYFKHINDSNSTSLSSSCSNNSISSVVVESLQTKTCSWLNGVSPTLLPHCESYPHEVDLLCHEIQLGLLAYEVSITLPGRNPVQYSTENWVSRFIDSNQISTEAYRLIRQQLY